MNKYNELYPSNWTNAAHKQNGSNTGSNQLYYSYVPKTTDKYTSQWVSASGAGQFDYSNPLPKSVKTVGVSISITMSSAGSSSTRVWVTDSSGKTVASGTNSVNLSAYVNSKEDLYLHIYATSFCEEHIGTYGAAMTSASVSKISLSY